MRNTGKTARIRKVRKDFFMAVYLKQWNRQIETFAKFSIFKGLRFS